MGLSRSHLKNVTLSKAKDRQLSLYETLQSLRPVKAIKRDILEILSLSKASYFYFIPLSIYIFRALELLMKEWVPGYTFDMFVTTPYIGPFIERFGVVYGILLPLILVRAWEQLDDIDREFDKEAETVKILYDEIFFLRGTNEAFVKEIAVSLRKYVVHVINNYPMEIKEPEDKIKKQEDEKTKGDNILKETRGKFKDLIRSNGMRTKEEEVLIPELIDKLNNIVDIRGNRIAIASQRLFESLLIVALITSIIFVLPFYFVSFLPGSGLLDNLLTTGVTLLVIVIFLILEDLDEPFGGIFKISYEAWQRILHEMDSDKRKLELENLGKPERKKNEVWRTRSTDKGKGIGKKKKPLR